MLWSEISTLTSQSGVLRKHGQSLHDRVYGESPRAVAYQTTILRAAHNYEGSNWVAYDCQFSRDVLARKDLNWSTPNAQLYNKAFMERTKAIPWCQYCLSDYHSSAACPETHCSLHGLDPSPLNGTTHPSHDPGCTAPGPSQQPDLQQFQRLPVPLCPVPVHPHVQQMPRPPPNHGLPPPGPPLGTGDPCLETVLILQQTRVQTSHYRQ